MNFNDIYIGQKASIVHVITEEDVHKFVDLTGDDNPLHTTHNYGKPIAHGMLGASFISTVIGTKLPGDGALWYSQTLEYAIPVRIDDTITIEAEVLEKEERDKTIILSTKIYNQHSQIITFGRAKVGVMEKKEEVVAPPDDTSKTALVIGGTGGIGREVCRELSRRGYTVIFTYFTDEKSSNSLKEELGDNCTVVWADIRDLGTEIMMGIKTDILINCASVPIIDQSIDRITYFDMEQHIDLNVWSNFYLAKMFLPYMEARGYGKIITLGTTAMDNPSGHWLPYITSKEALWGFTKALSHEVAPKGIRVNMVSPSLVETDLTADISQKSKLVLESKTPLRKTTTAKEVAKVIGFLVSTEGDSITGQNIRING